MKRTGGFALAMVTAPDMRRARKLARLALEARLAACANLVPKLESHYWWKGDLDSAAEVLLLFKTRRSLLPALEELILEHHPYSTPEFLTIPIAGGSAQYMSWLAAECPAK